MAELAVETKNLNFHLEQVQDFTPTPMTLATEIYYTVTIPTPARQYPLPPIPATSSRSDNFLLV